MFVDRRTIHIRFEKECGPLTSVAEEGDRAVFRRRLEKGVNDPCNKLSGPDWKTLMGGRYHTEKYPRKEGLTDSGAMRS